MPSATQIYDGEVYTLYSDAAGTVVFNQSNLKAGELNPHILLAGDWVAPNYEFTFACQTGNCIPPGTYYVSGGPACELVEICLGGLSTTAPPVITTTSATSATTSISGNTP